MKLIKTLLPILLLFLAARFSQAQVTFTTLYTFSFFDGSLPIALTQGADGNFYGVAGQGGTLDVSGHGCTGTLFKMTPDGTLTAIYYFSGPDGTGPVPGFLQGADGNFYATTLDGGAYYSPDPLEHQGGYGTVFGITAGGQLTTLASIDGTNGGAPFWLIQASDGEFYGTAGGGANGYGQAQDEC